MNRLNLILLGASQVIDGLVTVLSLGFARSHLSLYAALRLAKSSNDPQLQSFGNAVGGVVDRMNGKSTTKATWPKTSAADINEARKRADRVSKAL